jgi:hypothetical protein
VALVATLATALAAGCGDEDFANDPRPPVTVELTGVIQDDKVTVSPASLGAGPVRITISNQTERPYTVTLEGESLVRRSNAVNPGDTATLQSTLAEGTYEVRAGSEKAMEQEIAPALLEIGRERPASNNDLSLP